LNNPDTGRGKKPGDQWIQFSRTNAPQDAPAGLFWPDNTRDCLLVPLRSQDQLVGYIELFSSPMGFSQDSVRLFESAGNQIGVAIEKARLYTAEMEARQLAEVLRVASNSLSQSLDFDSRIETFLIYLEKLAPYNAATILFLEDEPQVIVRRSNLPGTSCTQVASGDPAESLLNIPMVQEIIRSQKGVLIEKVSEAGAMVVSSCPNPPCSQIALPMVAGGEVIGVCLLCKLGSTGFNRTHYEQVDTLVSQASAAIHNAWLYQQVSLAKQQLQALSRRLVDLQESERRYISRELHDEANQSLTYLIFSLDMLKDEATNPDAVLLCVSDLKGMVKGGLDSLHALAVNLRPASLDHLGLIPALRQYVEIVHSKYDLHVEFSSQITAERLPPEMETAIYRVVQEAVTNIAKHAKARNVEILLNQDGAAITALVKDDGEGFDPKEALVSGRLGLIGMRERTEMCGGCFSIHSSAGEGTQILLEFPDALK